MRDGRTVDERLADLDRRGIVRIGLDVGQARDHSAVVVCEEVQGEGDRPSYHARMIERMPLGVTYDGIAARVSQIVDNLSALDRQERAEGKPGFRIDLRVDCIGTGRPLIEMMQARGLRPISITLTGGSSIVEHDRYTVSAGKAVMVGTLQALLQNGELVLGDDDLADIVIRELQAYEIKVSENGHASFAARSGEHDDLVCAAGLAVLTWKSAKPGPVFSGHMRIVRAPWGG